MFGGNTFGTDGWMALGYILIFFFYAIVSVVEVVAWITWIVGDPVFAAFWVGNVGFWGATTVLWVPSLFFLMHFILPTSLGGLNLVATAANFSNDVFYTIFNFVFFAILALAHIMFTQPFLDHLKTMKGGCVCDNTIVIDVTKSEEENEAANKEACEEQCPPIAEKCYARGAFESASDYWKRCEGPDAPAEGEEGEGEEGEGEGEDAPADDDTSDADF